MAVDLQAQLAFVKRLRDGYVITTDQIKSGYNTMYPNRFANSVRIRTGLDIVKAKLAVDDTTGYQHSFNLTAYFLASDIHPEVAGLEFMLNAEESIFTDAEEVIEYQDGHYLMWVCPSLIHTVTGQESVMCGQFHKVDLGDEELDRPRTVRCVQCGKQYQVKPRD